MPAPALKPVAHGQSAPARPTGRQIAAQIAALLRDHSIEAIRPGEADLAALQSILPAGTAIYLSAVPGRPHSGLIEAAARIRARGFEPVPHLAARSLASHGALDELLSRLASGANVRRVLVIAGDRERAVGPFSGAIELIESGLLQRHGIVEVGIAGYPDGHPRLSPDTLIRALTAKIEAAEQTGLRATITTQFAFDPAAILQWLRRLRDLGIEHPVRIGMAGPADVATLLRYARRCGVRASAQSLARHAGLLKHLLGVGAPDRIVRALAEANGPIDAQPEGNAGIGRVSAHFFSFGGTAATARWAAAAAAGRIVLDRGEGFGVEPP
jgi:methylenetetrahydrofolate reductase (NADPH)